MRTTKAVTIFDRTVPAPRRLLPPDGLVVGLFGCQVRSRALVIRSSSAHLGRVHPAGDPLLHRHLKLGGGGAGVNLVGPSVTASAPKNDPQLFGVDETKEVRQPRGWFLRPLERNFFKKRFLFCQSLLILKSSSAKWQIAETAGKSLSKTSNSAPGKCHPHFGPSSLPCQSEVGVGSGAGEVAAQAGDTGEAGPRRVPLRLRFAPQSVFGEVAVTS